MHNRPSLARCASLLLLSSVLLCGADLSTYHEFQLGTNLPLVVKQSGMKLSDVTTLHQNPALLQELAWHKQPYPASPLEGDTVSDVTFSFYNGQLFRITAVYDRERTEQLTSSDIISAVSTTYGMATSPEADMVFPSVYNDRVKVVARWEDALSSVSLLRSSFPFTYAVILFSKHWDALAEEASVEAARQDIHDAPQREALLLKQQNQKNQVQQEQTRSKNKAGFRP